MRRSGDFTDRHQVLYLPITRFAPDQKIVSRSGELCILAVNILFTSPSQKNLN